jgi:hypothetical protein
MAACPGTKAKSSPIVSRPVVTQVKAQIAKKSSASIGQSG